MGKTGIILAQLGLVGLAGAFLVPAWRGLQAPGLNLLGFPLSTLFLGAALTGFTRPKVQRAGLALGASSLWLMLTGYGLYGLFNPMSVIADTRNSPRSEINTVGAAVGHCLFFLALANLPLGLALWSWRRQRRHGASAIEYPLPRPPAQGKQTSGRTRRARAKARRKKKRW